MGWAWTACRRFSWGLPTRPRSCPRRRCCCCSPALAWIATGAPFGIRIAATELLASMHGQAHRKHSGNAGYRCIEPIDLSGCSPANSKRWITDGELGVRNGSVWTKLFIGGALAAAFLLLTSCNLLGLHRDLRAGSTAGGVAGKVMHGESDASTVVVVGLREEGDTWIADNYVHLATRQDFLHTARFRQTLRHRGLRGPERQSSPGRRRAGSALAESRDCRARMEGHHRDQPDARAGWPSRSDDGRSAAGSGGSLNAGHFRFGSAR